VLHASRGKNDVSIARHTLVNVTVEHTVDKILTELFRLFVGKMSRGLVDGD